MLIKKILNLMVFSSLCSATLGAIPQEAQYHESLNPAVSLNEHVSEADRIDRIRDEQVSEARKAEIDKIIHTATQQQRDPLQAIPKSVIKEAFDTSPDTEDEATLTAQIAAHQADYAKALDHYTTIAQHIAKPAVEHTTEHASLIDNALADIKAKNPDLHTYLHNNLLPETPYGHIQAGKNPAEATLQTPHQVLTKAYNDLVKTPETKLLTNVLTTYKHTARLDYPFAVEITKHASHYAKDSTPDTIEHRAGLSEQIQNAPAPDGFYNKPIATLIRRM